MDSDDRSETLAATLDQLPILVAITEGDDQELVWLNEAGRALVGSRELSAWGGRPGRRLAEVYDEVWRTGQPATGADWRVETVDPSGVPREVWLSFTVAPVRWPDGRMRAVVGLGQEVAATVEEIEPAREPGDETWWRHRQATELVEQLQDAVLPTGLPVLPSVQIGARYLLAEDHAVAGGDWFDAIPLPDQRVVLVVGDVVGHGVEASVAMGELKTLFDERVRADGDIAAALEVLDHRSRRTKEARAATICACVLDGATGEVTYCTAGHPPPIVVTADGQARFLQPSGAGPLGSGAGFAVAQETLAVGDVLVLYSDGIVERPGRSVAQSTVELARVVEAAVQAAGPVGAMDGEHTVERVCRHTIEGMTRTSGYRDDISLLAAQRVPAVLALELRLPAVPEVIRVVRAELADWLRQLSVSALDELSLQHAVGELVTNAVEHAYERPGVDVEVRVVADLAPDGAVDVSVTDDGRWRDRATDESPERGRGLAMARGFVDELRLERRPDGTCARIRHRLIRPAAMLRGVSLPAGAVQQRSPGCLLQTERDRVSAAGEIDEEAAVRLRRELDRSSRGGTRAVTLDLSEVSLLASAGVQVLMNARDAGEVRLIAPAGSAAQHVLELVRLPYDAGPA